MRKLISNSYASIFLKEIHEDSFKKIYVAIYHIPTARAGPAALL